jgi:site-specific DNA recombinase
MLCFFKVFSPHRWVKTGKTGARHLYYYCYRHGCESRGKSIRRAEMEGQFENLLSEMKPSRTLFDLVQTMFKRAWDIQSANDSAHRQSITSALRDAEKKIENLLDRIVESTTSSVIAAYEKRIDTLEREKLVLQEKLQTTAKNKRPFAKMFKLTMLFLANPQDIWKNGGLEHKRTVLKLTFADKLTYCRKTGFQTPQISSIFGMLKDFSGDNCQMAEAVRFELTEGSHPRRFSRPVP